MLVVPVVAVLLNACGSPNSSKAHPGTETDRSATLRVGIDEAPNSYDPILVAAANTGPITLPLVYDQLLQNDAKDGQPTAMLATAWSFSDDGTKLTLKLRDDAVFNATGTKVDAQAVKANLDRAKTSLKSMVASSLTTMTSVRVVDATTVELQFTGPAYAFPATLAYDQRISSIVDPKYLDDPNLGTQPHGSGPYVLESASASKIVMNRVAKHWDSTSALAKRVEISVILNTNARLTGVQTGQLDIVGVLPESYDAAEKIVAAGKAKTRYGTATQQYSLRINPKRVTDPNVRKAISLAVDRDAFCSSQFPNMSKATQQDFVEGNPGYDASLDKDLTPNIAKAKELLQAAGAADLKLSIINLSSTTGRMEIIQQQLAAAGIKVEINTRATAAAMTTEFAANKYDVSLGGTLGTVDPATMVEQSIAGGVGFGIPDYLTALVTAANKAAPGKARDEAWGKVNKTLTDKPYYVPLCDIRFGVVGSTKVVGLPDARYVTGPIFDVRRIGIAQ